LLTWLSLPLAFQTSRIVLTQNGKPLNQALAKTGQLAFLVSVLFLFSMIIAGK
jgi:1,4-dihydroxy-2-naphthoate octaprenyltransferase